MAKSCGECLNRDKCTPDLPLAGCMPGYMLFLDPKKNLKKYCYQCGKKLLRQSPEKYSPEFDIVPLKCPDHGIIGYLEESFRKKKTPA